MGPTDSIKCARKLRGFTLIELIIVMAIIAILAGIMSLAIGGFQRDARMETNNNKAHIVYTGFQNALMQCEITQNDSVLNAAKLLESSGTTDANTSKRLTYSIVRFTMSGSGISGNIYLNSFYDNSASAQSSIILTNGSKQFIELEKVILGFLDNSFEGTVVAYLDADNYVTDAAMYFEKESDFTSNVSSGWLTILSMYTFDSDGGTKGKIFQAIEDVAEQKKLIKNKGIYCGSYPLMEQTESYYEAS